MTDTFVTEAPEERHDDKVVERELDRGLAVIAEDDSDEAYSDYKKERMDRQAHAKGAKEFNDADRTRERAERWEKIRNTVAHDQAEEHAAQVASQPQGHEQIQEKIAYAEAVKEADTRAEIFEREKYPGFRELTEQVRDEYGTLNRQATALLGSSPYSPEITVHICQNPKLIAQINQASRQDVAVFFAQLTGRISADYDADRTRPAPPRAVSTAPKPVSTVGGRSAPHAQSLEEMDYSTYRAHRMKGKR